MFCSVEFRDLESCWSKQELEKVPTVVGTGLPSSLVSLSTSLILRGIAIESVRHGLFLAISQRRYPRC